MTVLLLRLAGPLQAWGDSSRFTRRETRLEPTKSGVLGMLASASGYRRSDSLEDLMGLEFGVRVDQPGRLTRDFQTAIRWPSNGAPRKTDNMPLSYRYYLADAVFVAAVAGDARLVDGLRKAIRRPAHPLYLGRRSCPVTGRLDLGVREGALEEVLRRHPWEAAGWHRRRSGRTVMLELVVDAPPGESSAEIVRDLPLSFDPTRREYGWRAVQRPHPVVVDNEVGVAGPDFMAALGGA